MPFRYFLNSNRMALSKKMKRSKWMKRVMSVLLISVGLLSAKPIVFEDYGAIWVCSDGYMIGAEAKAKTVDISNDRLRLDKKLHYNKSMDAYLSRDGKTILRFRGKNLDTLDNVVFSIDGKPSKCYYEYMERG